MQAVGDIASAVAFLLPGYVATELRNALVRTKKRDNFERAASSLLLSLLAYLLAGCVVRVAYRETWLEHATISLSGWLFVAAMFAFAVGLGYLMARLMTWKNLQKWLYQHHVDFSQYPNVWNEMWHCEAQAPWVVVQMKDGAQVFGAVRAYTADPDETRRELWLWPVLDLTDPERKEIPGLSVYIPWEQIACVSVYRPDDRVKTA